MLENLSKHSSSFIQFLDCRLSYVDLNDRIEATDQLGERPFIWNGLWKSENFISLLRALKTRRPIISSAHLVDPLPPVEEGEVAFRSSGTEGKARWFFHPQEHFLEGASLDLKGHVKALLHPSHAAGFDLMFHCLRTGVSFGFSTLERLSSDYEASTIFGPPQALAALLFFKSKYSSVFENLSTFYVSTDSLSPVLAEKAKSIPSLKLKQFYGSSETMMIWIEEKQDEPWLLKFKNEDATVMDGKVIYQGRTLAKAKWSFENAREVLKTPFALEDQVSTKDDWLDLSDNKRNKVKLWGHTINLKHIEDAILSSDKVIDAKAELIKLADLNFSLKISVWTSGNMNKEEVHERLPEWQNIKELFSIEFKEPDSLSLNKKKRI